MPPAPLTRDRIVTAAAAVVRRHGPNKATVVDVARALGVSHAAVYRHFASKAELRQAVVGRWIESVMPPMRSLAADATIPAALRLRSFVESLSAIKRHRAAADPQLFAAYRTLAADAGPIVADHVTELVNLMAGIIVAGVAEGTFAAADPTAAARAVLWATGRYHHPAHADDWADPAALATFADVWRLIMAGLVARPAK